jgi:hypothetical protein
MERAEKVRETPVVINVNAPTAVLGTGDPALDVQVAARLLAGYRLNGATAIEVVYLGPFEWSDARTAVGDDDLGIPGALGLASLDFFGADVIRVDYTSKLDNVEINLARSAFLTDVFDLILGFRYVTLDEGFNINSTDYETGSSDYNIQTQNELYGGQCGLRLRRSLSFVAIELTGKAGFFASNAEQTQSVSDFPPPFSLRPQRTSAADGTAFLTELACVAVVPLDAHWNLRFGYNLIWIDDVALAPDQLDFSNTPASGTLLDDNGRIFLHGGVAGVECRW